MIKGKTEKIKTSCIPTHSITVEQKNSMGFVVCLHVDIERMGSIQVDFDLQENKERDLWVGIEVYMKMEAKIQTVTHWGILTTLYFLPNICKNICHNHNNKYQSSGMSRFLTQDNVTKPTQNKHGIIMRNILSNS